jgi:hypothetical protein
MRALRRRGSRYLLRTDINQFYPSIYTHSIPWALHTKAACKAALHTHAGNQLWGTEIDKAFQYLNEGQTHGIPIGPDPSLVAAEILLAATDQDLLARCPGLVRGFRYLDDYELSFGNLSDAEKVLTELESILADYALALNPRKTKIEELPISLADSWGTELGAFRLREAKNPVGQRNDIVAFFGRAFEVAKDQREHSVLRYAISRVQGEKVHSSGWRAFQNCVLGAAGADASALAVALGTLYKTADAGGHSVSKSPLEETLGGIIERHAPRKEGSEVAWALWGALAWSVPLHTKTVELLGNMEDDFVALLALDADARGLIPAGALDKNLWAGAVNQSDVLKGEHWLLCYEANQKGWLQSQAVANDPDFLAMSNGGVSFYDTAQNVPQFPEAARSFPGGNLAAHYA